MRKMPGTLAGTLGGRHSKMMFIQMDGREFDSAPGPRLYSYNADFSKSAFQ